MGYWLVVYLPLWKMMEWKSVGMMFHSQYDGKVINSCSSYHQPGYIYIYIKSWYSHCITPINPYQSLLMIQFDIISQSSRQKLQDLPTQVDTLPSRDDGQEMGVMDFSRKMGEHCWLEYPLVMSNIAIENGPLIVDFPMKHGDFHVGNSRINLPCWGCV